MKRIPPSNYRPGRRYGIPGVKPEIWSGNLLKGATYQNLMYHFREGDTHDAYGWSVGALYDIAGGVYLATGEVLPDYDPGPMRTSFANRNLSHSEIMSAWHGAEWSEARWIASMIRGGTFDISEVRDVYAVIKRYVDWVKIAGEDY